jgi:predicted nucleotidyltransferase
MNMLDDSLEYFSLTPAEKSALTAELNRFLIKNDAIIFAYVYGSFCDFELPFKDIDVGLYLGPEARDIHFLEILAVELEHLFHFPFDLRPLNDAAYSFLFHVFQGKMLFTKQDEITVQMIQRVGWKYLDILPFWKTALKEVNTP